MTQACVHADLRHTHPPYPPKNQTSSPMRTAECEPRGVGGSEGPTACGRCSGVEGSGPRWAASRSTAPPAVLRGASTLREGGNEPAVPGRPRRRLLRAASALSLHSATGTGCAHCRVGRSYTHASFRRDVLLSNPPNTSSCVLEIAVHVWCHRAGGGAFVGSTRLHTRSVIKV